MNPNAVHAATTRPGRVAQQLGGLLLAGLLASGPAARAANFTTGTDSATKYGVHEVALNGDGSVANPFDTVATVTFVPASGGKSAKSVRAFFDGDSIWRARVYVSEAGEWTWTSACPSDKRSTAGAGSSPPATPSCAAGCCRIRRTRANGVPKTAAGS